MNPYAPLFTGGAAAAPSPPRANPAHPQLIDNGGEVSVEQLLRGIDCPASNGCGYRGRVNLYEDLEPAGCMRRVTTAEEVLRVLGPGRSKEKTS